MVVFAPLLGAGIVTPLLPVYAYEHGAGGMIIGLIFASFSISRTVLLPYFGRRSDRRGRRQMIIAGLMLNTLTSILYILSQNPYHLMVARLVQGASAAMIWPIATAYVGDIAPRGREGAYMGLFNLATFTGLAAGPMLGGTLKDLASIDAAFWAMGAISLLGVILAATLLPPQEPYRIRPKTDPPPTLPLLKKDSVLRGLFLFRVGYGCVMAMNWSFQPLFMDNVLKLSSSLIGFLVGLQVALAALLQVPMGKLADRLSRRGMILFGGGLQALSMAILPFSESLHGILAVNLGIGLAGGISMPALQALVTALGREARMMGTWMAVLFTGQSLGMLVGPLLAGGLFYSGSFHALFWIGGVVSLLSLLPVIIWVKPGGTTFFAGPPG